MPDLYDDADADVVEAWVRKHKNGDETHVVVLEVADTYLAEAVDLDGQGEVLGTEMIATSLTESEAIERARRWAGEHPKGLEDSSGGLGGLLG